MKIITDTQEISHILANLNISIVEVLTLCLEFLIKKRVRLIKNIVTKKTTFFLGLLADSD